jgi:hypothetical protein
MSKVEGSRRPKTGGRKKGTPNRVTAALKDMILTALDEAHPDGSVAYLKAQASANPTAFLTLVGKVLPLQVTGDADNPVAVSVVKLVGVRAN